MTRPSTCWPAGWAGTGSRPTGRPWPDSSRRAPVAAGVGGHGRLGRHDEAVGCYLQAIERYRDLGDRIEKATTLTNLGDAHHAMGKPDAARDAWRCALEILLDLEHPDAPSLRWRLDGDPPIDQR